MRLNGDLVDVLGPVRDVHVAALLETLAEELSRGAEVDAEPVDRTREGRILRTPPLELPRRGDICTRRNGRSVILRADPGRAVCFRPIDFTMSRRCRVRIEPFQWGKAQIRARKTAGAPDWTPVRRWFLEWFQARFGEESPDLLGVAHAIEGPEASAEGWSFTIDLGSVSVAGFAAMLDAFARTGCAEIRVGDARAVASDGR